MTVTPKTAPQAWAGAGRDAARRIAEDPPTDNDCEEVRVEVSGGEARVTLSTRDGRSATRPIRSPDQLAATISALASTIKAPAPAADTPAPAPAPAAPPEAPAMPSPMHIVLHGLGGWGFAGPGGYGGAEMELSAGVALRWAEFGAFVDWQPSTSVKSPPKGFKMWMAKSGARLGLRAPAGPVSILAGGRLGLGVISQIADDPREANTTIGSAVAEPIMGAYTGAVWPNSSPIRVRGQISIDGVLTRFGSTRNLDEDLSDLPAWSASLLVGIEGQLL